jgi:hypothetical protein
VQADVAEHLVEELLKEVGGALGVGVGQGGAPRSAGHAEVLELALAAAESGVDLAQALGLGKLAEEHGDEVVPAGESLGAPLATGLADELGEAISVDERKKLAEKTRSGYIHRCPPCSDCDWFFIHPDSIRSGRVFQSAVLDSSGGRSEWGQASWINMLGPSLESPHWKISFC